MTLTIGVDPGPTPGVCAVPGVGPIAVLQCDAASLLPLVRALIEAWGDDRVILAVEQWVIGRVSRTAGSAGRTTRRLIGELGTLADRYDDVGVVLRTAADVKPWADDARLRAAGLYERTAGLPHARDAARHALFSTVRDSGCPDPLGTTRP